jgi:hypothetical protein
LAQKAAVDQCRLPAVRVSGVVWVTHVYSAYSAYSAVCQAARRGARQGRLGVKAITMAAPTS